MKRIILTLTLTALLANAALAGGIKPRAFRMNDICENPSRTAVEATAYDSVGKKSEFDWDAGRAFVANSDARPFYRILAWVILFQHGQTRAQIRARS